MVGGCGGDSATHGSVYRRSLTFENGGKGWRGGIACRNDPWYRMRLAWPSVQSPLTAPLWSHFSNFVSWQRRALSCAFPICVAVIRDVTWSRCSIAFYLESPLNGCRDGVPHVHTHDILGDAPGLAAVIRYYWRSGPEAGGILGVMMFDRAPQAQDSRN